MKRLAILFFALCMGSTAQNDSVRVSLKLFDLNVMLAPAILPDNVNHSYVSSFAPKQELMDESKGYHPFGEFYQTDPAAMDFGLQASFKTEGSDKVFLKKVKPRISVYGRDESFFDYGLSYYTKTPIDSLYFTNPQLYPFIIDSTFSGRAYYSARSYQIGLEFGLNYDLITRSYFNFYSGLVISQAYGFKNEFTLDKRETYSITRYPGEISARGGTLKSYKIEEKIPAIHASRLYLCFGVQHRFSQRHNFSLGFFVESRFGINYFQIQGGISRFYPFAAMSGGARFSFMKHK